MAPRPSPTATRSHRARARSSHLSPWFVLPTLLLGACKQLEHDPVRTVTRSLDLLETLGGLGESSAPSPGPGSQTEPQAGPSSAPVGVTTGPSSIEPSVDEVHRGWVPAGSAETWTLLATDLPLPGTLPGASTVTRFRVSRSGHVAVLVSGPSAGKPVTAIWVGSEGVLERAVATGSTSEHLEVMKLKEVAHHEWRKSGFAPATIAQIEAHWLADDGSVGFRALLEGLPRRVAYFLARKGQILPLALVGGEKTEPFDDLMVDPPRSSFDLVRGVNEGSSATMTSNGEFLVLTGNRESLVLAGVGTHRLLLAKDQAAPGLPDGIRIAGIFEDPVTEGPFVLASATLAGPGLQNPVALYQIGAEGAALVARQPRASGRPGRGGHVVIPGPGGPLVAGRPPELAPVQTIEGRAVRPSRVAETFAIDDRGDLVLCSEGLEGLWAGPAGALERVLLPEGTPLPPGPVPVFEWKASGECLAILTAFGTIGPSVLLVGRPDALTPLVKVGDELEIGPGDTRLLRGLRLLEVSARGEALVQAEFAAQEGVRDESTAYLLVRARS